HDTRGYRALVGSGREVETNLTRLGRGWTIEAAAYYGPPSAFAWIAKGASFALLSGSFARVETELKTRAADGWKPQAVVYPGPTRAAVWLKGDDGNGKDTFAVVLAPTLEELQRRVADAVADEWKPIEFLYQGPEIALGMSQERDSRYIY